MGPDSSLMSCHLLIGEVSKWPLELAYKYNALAVVGVVSKSCLTRPFSLSLGQNTACSGVEM